ncbi:MAG: hypothetical protein ABIB04_04630 [Patescibacteria group bacterium]
MERKEQQFRIAEIDVAKNPTDEKVVGIFRFEAAGHAKHGPILLIVAEINSTLYVYERLLDVINATAEQARLLMTGVGQDPITRFEKLIQKLNDSLANFAEAEATPLSWNRVNIFIMDLSENHVCLAGVGQLMNMFLQKQDDGSFRSFDLFGSLEQPANVDPKKPFASLICGDIKPGDVLIAGSQNLERLRADLRIKEKLSSLPPVTAALEIKQDLEKRGIPDHFIAAIVASFEIKPQAITEKATTDTSDPQSTTSIQKLRNTEEEAEQRLSPIVNPISSLDKPDIKNLLASIRQGSKKILTVFGRNKNRDAMAMQSLRGMNAGYSNIFTKKRKAVLIIVALGLLAVMIGIGWWNHAKKVAAEIAAWNASYDSAADHLNKVESDLIYGNEIHAKQELAQAEDIINKLPSDNSDRKEKIDKLNTELDGMKEKLKKIVKLDNVTELSSLSPTATEGSLTAPVISKDYAYAVDNSAKVILKIKMSTKETEKISLPDNTEDIVSSYEGSTTILFATRTGKLFALKKADGSVDQMTWSHTNISNIADIVLYASKIYSLDPDNNQIWRSQVSGGSVSQEAAYVKAASTELKDAVSLAVDSSVYVLKKDGVLIRFMSGGQEGFSLATIDPIIRAASAVWTDANTENLYITDPADRRILIFDKNGLLKAQLVSTQFNALRDIISDEINKRAIVIDGNRLLLVPLP